MAKRLRVINMVDLADPRATAPPRPSATRLPRAASLQPCHWCGSGCCGLRVKLLAVEALRLSAALGVALDIMVKAAPSEPNAPDRIQQLAIPLDAGPVTLELQRSVLHGKCVFWMDVGGRGRCGVYALRPSVCRLFPYEVQDGDAVVRTGSQAQCPTTWLKDAASERALLKEYRRYTRDLRREARLLRAWSERVSGDRSWPGFVAFACAWMATWEGTDFRRVQEPEVFLPRGWGPALW